jgi:hypothetical protein
MPNCFNSSFAEPVCCQTQTNHYETKEEGVNHMNELSLSHTDDNSYEKPFLCKFCKKRYKDKRCFKRHERAHLKNNRHICKVCNKCFSAHRSLKRHEKLHSRMTSTSFKLPDNYQTHTNHFATREGLNMNELSHTDENSYQKPFVCKFCKKRYKDKRCFKRHESAHETARLMKKKLQEKKVHSKIIPHSFKLSDKCLETKSHLKQSFMDKHGRAYFKKDTYTCKVCNQSFHGN